MKSSMDKWLELSASANISIENKDRNFVVLNRRDMDKAFLESFDEVVKLPQIQEILKVLSRQ